MMNIQSTLLPHIAKMNWAMCEFAWQKGFACVDAFAQFMGADYDSNGDGQIDSDASRHIAGENKASSILQKKI